MNKIKDFYSYINERYYINNLSEDIVLLSVGLNKQYCKFLLFDTINKKPIGYISFGFYKEINSFTVDGIYSDNGYGAFLYECAMTFVYPNGLSMSRLSSTSEDALQVQYKFYNRNDVKKERMYSDEMTYKKEEFYDQEIIDLEDTRFYYTFGKEKLKNLITIGKVYAKNNRLSWDKIEDISYELENI